MMQPVPWKLNVYKCEIVGQADDFKENTGKVACVDGNDSKSVTSESTKCDGVEQHSNVIVNASGTKPLCLNSTVNINN